MKTRLILRPGGHSSSKRFVEALRKRLPDLEGRAIRIRYLAELTAGSRKLYSRCLYGQPVYAATFIRKRKIVLDSELASKPDELSRILTHELFHFAWVRLSNAARHSFQALLRREWSDRATGELGWSAESRKRGFSRNTRRRRDNWRDYACESFCDTAAWMYSGVSKHPEYTLAGRYRTRRAAWFHATFRHRSIPI